MWEAKTPLSVPYSHRGHHRWSPCERCGSLLKVKGDIVRSWWQPHFVQLCRSREVGLCFLLQRPEMPLLSHTRQPALQHSQAAFGWKGHEERESKRAVIVFQFNQLRCDRPTSIGPAPSPTLTPLWDVSSIERRADTNPDCQLLPTLIKKRQTRSQWRLKTLQEYWEMVITNKEIN